MTLKVVHLVYSFGIGGLERVIVNLINSSVDRDVEHYVVTLVDDHAFSSHLGSNATMHCLDKNEGKDLLCNVRLYRLLKKLKADVVHTYNFGTIEYHPIAWLAGVPVRVHAEHGRESSYKKIDNPAKYEFFRKLMIPFLSYFVVVSQDLEKWGRERLGLNDKLKLIFNGISLKEFERKAASIKENSDDGTENDRPFKFVSVGRLVDVKNHALLIDAFDQARQQSEQFKSTQLSIVGDGPNRAALQTQINTRNLSAHVSLLGNSNNVPAILNQADVFVLSSRYEAMPMTALEAMACKLPVIAPDVGGVSFILKNKANGLLVEANSTQKMAEALSYAYQHKAELNEMGLTGRKMVEAGFSVEAMTECYFNLYQTGHNKATKN
jgi:sugar transferase (PEP-CTERM/EpsH1 system associated)